MIYLASVYSLNADKALMEERYQFALAHAAKYTLEGVPVFSPIVHSHPMSQTFAMPTTFPFWEKLDYQYLDASDALWVLMMEGWQDSRGVTAEIAYASSQGLPIRYIEVVNSPAAGVLKVA